MEFNILKILYYAICCEVSVLLNIEIRKQLGF